MAFKPLNKLFRPWLSASDPTVANYSLYKCFNVSEDHCLPSVVYNSQHYMNRCEGNGRQCWTRLAAFESHVNSVELNYNLMHLLMKAGVRPSVPVVNGQSHWPSLASHHTNAMGDRNITTDVKHKYWLTKYKRQRPKRFNCPHCQIAFSNNGQLKGHIRTHTGERPFVCDQSDCGKSFTRNEELTRHRRIHTGIRPYSCVICAKRFGRKDHLKKHQRTHEKRFYSIAANNTAMDSTPQTSSSSSSSLSSVTTSYSPSNSLSSFYNSMYLQIKQF